MNSAAVVAGLILAFCTASPLLACTDGVQPSGAKYRICMPPGSWNKQLIVYAHGYVSADRPIEIPEDQLTLPDGTSLASSFTSFGYAFATTSYRTNGLAILEGKDDLRELLTIFNKEFGRPDKTFLGGVSEGGLIAALAAESSPSLYNAVISACGPIGSFRGQINYVGDARVLFDYFFPGVLPGSVISVPAELWTNWTTVYVPRVKAALAANPDKRNQLLRTSQVPVAGDDATTADNIVEALRYSAMATNDAIAKLGGQPYGNRDRFYWGSSNDFELNSRVPRYTANDRAIRAMTQYDTSGQLRVPMVTIHTTADPIVPWSHQLGYYLKALSTGATGKLTQLPVFRNGHCNFQAGDIAFAFLVMLAQQ